MMRSDEDIAAIVSETLQESFPDDVVSGVHVKRDVDHEGDPIFWVSIVIEDGRMPLERRWTLPFGSRLWFRLRDLGEAGFPVVSYVSRAEDEELGDLAA